MRENAVFAHTIKHSRLPLCITDATLPDEPIVFANKAFCDLTGYDESDFIGRNCRFLQGPDTARASVEAIHTALAARDVAMIEIVNYRKNGEKFINALQIGPIYDEAGNLIFRFGSQLDITATRERERLDAELRAQELLHRLKNIVNVMSVVIKMTGRTESDPSTFSEKVIQRLSALGQAHFDTLPGDRAHAPLFKQVAKTLLLAYAPLGEGQVNFHGADVTLCSSTVTSLTLLLHELATNSVKHGSLGSETGHVDLSWSLSDENEFTLIWQERGGPVVAPPVRENGTDIVSKLIAASSGSLHFDWQADGLAVRLKLPLGTA